MEYFNHNVYFIVLLEERSEQLPDYLLSARVFINDKYMF